MRERVDYLTMPYMAMQIMPVDQRAGRKRNGQKSEKTIAKANGLSA